VVRIETALAAHDRKWSVLREIERELGRRREPDANSPRTIDHDLLVYDGEPLDPNIERRAFVASPLVELAPALALPDGRRIAAIAEHLPRDGMVAQELAAELKYGGARWTMRRSNAL
jgi:2-amino-4-hydroxy-6-hydroxymethyldihydropteridine diphosphokinase